MPVLFGAGGVPLYVADKFAVGFYRGVESERRFDMFVF
jgi:hypothetical protein